MSHDMLGLYPRTPPRFVRQYASMHEGMRAAFQAYSTDVRCRRFPLEPAPRAPSSPQPEELQQTVQEPTQSYSFTMPSGELADFSRLADMYLESRALELRGEHEECGGDARTTCRSYVRPLTPAGKRGFHTLSRKSMES